MTDANIIKQCLISVTSIILVVISYKITTSLLIATHSFLALTQPVEAEVLIVEGWLFDYMLEDAAKEIKNNNYEIVITTGEKRVLNGSHKYNKFTNTANCCKHRLALLGIDNSKIIAIPADKIKLEHTYNTALAIKKWVDANNVKTVNVFTGGAHGRKSQVLFQKALGRDIKVGIISCKIKHYDSAHWWTSSRGIWNTFRYFAGYLYALVR